MEILFALLVLCVGNSVFTGGFSSQKASNVELSCFFVANLIKLLNKQLSYLKLSNLKCLIAHKQQGMYGCVLSTVASVDTLRTRQNGRNFPEDIFKCIFLNENVSILIKISLKFVPKGPINNIPALVQTMAWRRPGDKPLSEPMMVSSTTHICVSRPQWVEAPGHSIYSAD